MTTNSSGDWHRLLTCFLREERVVVSSDLDGIHLEAGEHEKLGLAERVREMVG